MSRGVEAAFRMIALFPFETGYHRHIFARGHHPINTKPLTSFYTEQAEGNCTGLLVSWCAMYVALLHGPGKLLEKASAQRTCPEPHIVSFKNIGNHKDAQIADAFGIDKVS